jgi:hypothetical protein
MTPRVESPSSRTIDQARAAVAARLRGRLPDLEAAVAARVYSISEPRETADPEYVQGLRESLSAALEYGIAAIELGEQRAPAAPPALLAQACMAARNRIPLDTVLRRYFAGYFLLTEYVIHEAEDAGLVGDSALLRLLRGQAAVFDHLIATVTEEHRREESKRPSSAAGRRAQRIERLLAGEVLDTTGLGYSFEGHHLGIVARGAGIEAAIAKLRRDLDCRVLSLPRQDETTWAWLGSQHALFSEEVIGMFGSCLPGRVRLSIGESAQGISGWRLTHHQAGAALPVAVHGRDRLVRYADVALLATILQDELLATSLGEIFLKPLTAERDGGRSARETLRAYFACERNAASTAAALSVSRSAVVKRLSAIERRIGRPVARCGAELEAAVRAAELFPRDLAAGNGS